MQRWFRWSLMALCSCLILVLLGSAFSCASRDASPSEYYSAPAAAPREEAELSRDAPPPPPAPMQAGTPASMSAKPSKLASRSRDPSGSSSFGKQGGKVDPAPQEPAAEPSPKRSIYYSGYLKMRVTRPQEALDQAAGLAKGLGGFVERLSATAITLRVPVDSFQKAFDQVAALGDVLEKSISAEDVTDALMEIGLRLDTARATRERLIVLLAKARNEQEKLELLRQIQRLTEEIDRMESQIRTLQSLASFSRLTLEVQQREAMTARTSDQDVAEFRWIHQLSPFQRLVAAMGKRLEFQIPKGLVELGNKRTFITESADGTVFWASRRANQPEGSTVFWLEALKSRLAPEFGAVTVQEMGGFQILRLVDRSEKPYLYWVGVKVNASDLELIEVYFPDATHEKRYGAEILKAIEGGRA